MLTSPLQPTSKVPAERLGTSRASGPPSRTTTPTIGLSRTPSATKLAHKPIPIAKKPAIAPTKPLAAKSPGATAAVVTSRSAPVAPASNNNNNTTTNNKEVDDLKAKLRVLEKKRIDDRDKLASLERVQGERDRFEKIIQTLQHKYQPQQQELADLRRQLKEAETRFDHVEKLQEEHESALEMATLDREMAEEMAEVYKTELDVLKQKAEELELELDILREENAEFTKGMTVEDRASTGWLQMEKNNERLREALLRLRDISREQEDELKDEIKGLREDLAEFDGLKEQLETCKQDLAQRDAAVEDLREQLDNALGAEDIIETLTEQTMNQSEKIKELEANIEELVELKEIGDEMDVNHTQYQKEMQHEINAKDAIIAEQMLQAAADKKSVEDLEYTVSRFRELVTSLQGDLADMRASHAVTENESEELNARSRALLDLNMKLQISASKTQTKTIDLELRRMEAQEAEQHLEIVTHYLPEAYEDDKPSVLAYLRFNKLGVKASILNCLVKEPVKSEPLPGHEDEFFHTCGAVDKLTWVTAMCNRFAKSIRRCSPEQFAKHNSALHELEPVERTLDRWLEPSFRAELRVEQYSAELQRTIALLTHLAEVHIPTDPKSQRDHVDMKAQVMQGHLDSAAVALSAVIGMTQRVVHPTGDDELGDHFAKRVEVAVTETRNAKVIAGKLLKTLETLQARGLAPAWGSFEEFDQCELVTSELAQMSRTIGLDLFALLHDEGRTVPHTFTEVQSCIQNTMSAFGSSEVDLFSAYLNKLRAVTSKISDLTAPNLTTLSEDIAYFEEFKKADTPPWALRGQELKEQKKIPVEVEAEARRLKDDLASVRRTLAIREEDFSTAQLKIETLESRMRDAKAKASRISELESEIENYKEELVSVSDNVAKQDRELKTLEQDRDRWKQAANSRIVDDMDDESGSVAEVQEAFAEAHRQLESLRTDMRSMQASLRYSREDSRRARMKEQPNHDWLSAPLTIKVRPVEQHKASIAAESREVLGELVNVATRAKIFVMASLPADKMAWKPAKTTPQYHAAKQMEEFGAWKGEKERVVAMRKTLKGKSPARDRGEGGSGRDRGRVVTA